ncbi:CDP-glucose 4,6-dehydratase [Coraliomargarita akajimensis]|uniref:CDP-glucose 4,6-dehydratase n=1 Tax=Coraliomargarita akajimensis (strain DSM 45221 / IAM 15411 / JCM 23193 / KCTC 12865 / 04OKA010-24) TaxID=583355 RepID=D5EMM0_CORAD|nr:CDP-glucose 4,6-dehydratase [Coraliomargarita akajimensis]ADE53426.1 CDP-glucose 4,6-dehydratase [Coraliomargarita akajimensis DSM 45221]
MDLLKSHYSGKRVLLTGHTGFKGAWMAEWLLDLGAEVVGVSLEPNTSPSLFEQLNLANRMEHHIADIREADRLHAIVQEAQPDIVFHLAAQPLVRYSYEQPVETFASNVMGTVHLLEALRFLDKRCQAVFITTDKCYENLEQRRPYSEEDRMGGHDPYSASKGAAELVIASYRRSFFEPAKYGDSHQIALASARAGNVIGGGDWALDRILPDCMRTLAMEKPVPVRNQYATRPWQHVLEPLGGYLLLGLRLAQVTSPEQIEAICSGFNFGPDPEANRPVRDLVEKVLTVWPGSWEDQTQPNAPHEAGLLNLTIHKAADLLGWQPVWDFDTAVEQTVRWYKLVHADNSVAQVITQEQIKLYAELLANEIH